MVLGRRGMELAEAAFGPESPDLWDQMECRRSLWPNGFWRVEYSRHGFFPFFQGVKLGCRCTLVFQTTQADKLEELQTFIPVDDSSMRMVCDISYR